MWLSMCITPLSVSSAYFAGELGFWYSVCESVEPGMIVAVRYVKLASDSLGLAMFQGLFFFCSCYELTRQATKHHHSIP